MIHILGASGIIGKGLYYEAQQSNALDTFLFYTRNSTEYNFDLSNKNTFKLDAIKKGEIAFLLSAISSPQYCEENSMESNKINFTYTKELIQILLDRGVKVFFASSDVVYGNDGDLKNENSPINPQSNYAENKTKIENYFVKNDLFTAFRMSFCANGYDAFSKYVVDSIKESKEIYLYANLYRNVYDTSSLFSLLYNYAKGRIQINYRIINIGGDTVTNRLDFKTFIKDLNGKIIEETFVANKSWKIEKIHLDTSLYSELSQNKNTFDFKKWKQKIKNQL